MKTLLSALAFFLSFGLGFITNAAEISPDVIVLPRFKCSIEVTFYVIYEPNAGPNRTFDSIRPALYEWATMGTLIDERARITDNRIDEDGTRVITRATTIRTTGGVSLTLTKSFLGKIIRYNVEDPTTRIVFMYWEPGMEKPERNIRQPQCKQ